MTRKKMPKIGREVITPDGTGPVTDLNIVKETIFVRLSNGDTSEIKEYPLEEISRLQEIHPKQESQRKQTTIPNKPETHEEKTIIETNDDESFHDDVITQDKESKDSASGTGNTAYNPDANKSKSRKSVLGQPVKRENPNRTDIVQKQKDGQNENKIQNDAKELCSSSNTPGESWADALEKAMKAIGHDK